MITIPERVSKTLEKRPKAIGNEPSRKYQSGVASISLIDNRPEAAQLKQLQNMTDNSPQVANTNRFQAMADRNYSSAGQKIPTGEISGEPGQIEEYKTGLPDLKSSGIENLHGLSMRNSKVHQLAPVTTGKLNVIGEYHDESDKRIGREKNYLREAAGSDGYWDEETFKIGEFSISWGALIDRRQMGDPTWTRLEFGMSALVDNLRATLTNLRSGAVLSMKTHDELHLWYWNYWKNVQFEIGRWFQTSLYDLSEGQVAKIRDSRDAAAVADAKMDALTVAVRTKAEIPAALFDARVSVDAFAKKLYTAIRTPDVIRDDRDLKIHSAANAGSDRRGAWKIGDAHVRNLIDPSKSPRYDNKEYNVTTRAEFNRELPVP